MRGRAALMLAMVMLVLLPVVLGSPYVFNSYVSGDCSAGAQVNITIYEEGTSTIDQTQVLTAGSDGGYGTAITPSDMNGVYDITINATNAACSPSVSASRTHLSIAAGGLSPVSVDGNVTMQAPFENTLPVNGTMVGSNQTQFTWDSDYLGVNYTLEVATTSSFGASIVLSRSVAGLSYTIQAGEELADDDYYWRVRAINGSGSTIDTTAWSTYSLTTGTPIISSPSPANASWAGSSTLSLSMSTDMDAYCRWSTSAGTAYQSKSPFSVTGTTAHQATLPLASEGANTIYLQCNNSLTGQVADEYVYVVYRDTTAPTAGSVVVEGGAAYSTDTTIDFNWSGYADAESGISRYHFSFTDGGGTSAGTLNTSPSSGQLTGAAQGSIRVYVWAEDAAGNLGVAASDSIIVDSLPPSFSGWSSSPPDLTKYTTTAFNVTVTISDTSSLQTHPTLRHRIGTDSWSAPSEMTLLAASGNSWQYSYSIEEAPSPNTWFERNGENLTFVVSATDINGFTNNVTRYEFINDQSTAPVIDPIADLLAIEDNVTQFNLTGSDADLNAITYSCNLSGATITRLSDTSARVTWTPTNDDVGARTYSCNASDGTFTSSRSFTATVANVNDVPVLQPVGDLYAQEYEFFNYSLNASDVDGDPLTYSSNNSVFSLNRYTGSIAFTPFGSHRGSYAVNLSVSDGNGGVAYEEIAFTVGYCGDAVCREGYETCGSCELDCGVCGEQESQAVLLEARNCLGEEMTVQAVTLVPRASCAEEGMIVDDMEVCGNKSDTTLKVFLEVGADTWEEVVEVVTDSDGYASFTLEEEGDYRIGFSTDEQTATPFTISACLGGDEEAPAAVPSEPSVPSQPVVPPVMEEPSIEEVESRWSFFSVMLYFLLIPLLLVALVVSTLGYAYREERKRGKHTQFVAFMEKWYGQRDSWRKRSLAWLRKTPPFDSVLKQLAVARSEAAKAWRFVSRLAVEYWYELLLAVGLRRRIRLQYYPLEAPGKQLHLLLVSLLKNLFPKRPVDELLALVHQYSIKSLLDLGAMLLSFGVRATYADPHPSDIAYLNALIGKGLRFRSRPATRVDIESALLEGRPVVCLVNELGDRGSVVQSLVIMYAFDKTSFYYHDYIHGRQELKAAKDQFMHAWSSAGQRALFMRL